MERQQRASPVCCAPAGRHLYRRLQVHAASSHKLAVKAAHSFSMLSEFEQVSSAPSQALHNVVACHPSHKAGHGRLDE